MSTTIQTDQPSYFNTCRPCIKSKWFQAALLVTSVALLIIGSIGLFASTPLSGAIGYSGCFVMMISGGVGTLGTLLLLVITSCSTPNDEPVDDLGRTALCCAAFENDTAKVKFLLNHHANPNIPDEEGRTPLMYAAQNGNLEVAQALLYWGGNTKAIDNKSKTVVRHAVKFAHEAENRVAIIDNLVAAGANVNTADHKGRTPLMYAAEKRNLPAVRTLLAHGAEVDVADDKGRTALMYAAQDGWLETIRVLIDKGADASAVDNKGKSVIRHAFKYLGDPYSYADDENVFANILEVLIPAGADVNVADHKGKTLLMCAIYDDASQVVHTLLAHGAKPDVKAIISIVNRLKNCADLIPTFVAEGCDVNARDEKGRTPLMLAAKYNEPATVRVLLAHGANPKITYKNGRTALYHASDSEVRQILKESLIKSLF